MAEPPRLRPYQERDLAAVREAMRVYRSVLLVSPTGSGKGTLFSYIVHSASARGKRIIFLVNRRTLVHDMSKRLDRLGIDHGVIMGDDKRRKPWLPVHVASIDTLHRREHTSPADLLILDEAHFAVSPTWKKVIDRYPNAKLLLGTATPIRLDGRGLCEIADFMVQGSSVQELIGLGYLVPSVVFRPKGAPDLSGVEKTAGEFNQKQLAEVCDKPKLIGDVVEQWTKHAGDRKTVSFGVSQHHASEIAEKFRCAGVTFAYVDADTPDDERDRIWEDFDNGSLRGISSVGVVSYGWDHPICSCIIGARATASVGLWRQILGRGSRPHPGKENFLVMDHFDNTGRLDAFFEDDVQWSLDGKAVKESAEKTISITTCRRCFATFRSGPDRCPYCLAEIQKFRREIETVKGELEQVERKALAIQEWRERVTGDDRRKKFEEFRFIAQERGYKKTWPAVKFHIIFGQWPPREWTRSA
jgi:superfamily II DNA or RNA helicase